MVEDFGEGAALVVGGSGGIGSAIVKCFAERGSDVAICYNSKREPADTLAEAVRAMGRKASVHQINVTDPDAVTALVDDAAKAHGRLHSIVFGAGPVVEQVALSETSHKLWRQSVDIEVHGFFNLLHASVPLLRKQGGGSYVTLGTAGDYLWPDKDGLSIAPKAANDSLVRGIAREEGKHGIRANSVLVGVIEAGMMLELTQRGQLDKAWEEHVKSRLALKYWGKPEDIAEAVVFLASNRARYVTGERISVAGGYGV